MIRSDDRSPTDGRAVKKPFSGVRGIDDLDGLSAVENPGGPVPAGVGEKPDDGGVQLRESGLLGRLFPKRARVTLGIDIGARSVKMILMRSKGKAIESLSPIIVRRPVSDAVEKGRIDEVIPLIKESTKDFRGEINNVVVSVQGSAVMTRRVEVPPMPKGELKTAIPWIIGKFLPYPVEEAIYDYRILEERQGKGAMELIVVVAQREWINLLNYQLRKIGLPPSIMTVAPLAMGNLLNRMGTEEGGSDVMINIGERVTSICFYSGGRLEFSRDIMTAGEAITESLTGRVTYKGKEFAIGPEKAEETKCRYGIPMGEISEFTDMGIATSSIQAMIRPAVERLATEIDRSIKYASQNYHIEDINRVWITGGSANLVNLSTYLSSVLGHRIGTFNPATEIGMIHDALDEGSETVFRKFGLSLSVALGLALDEGEGINLISTGVQDIRTATLERKLLRTGASLLLLILAGTSINMEVKRKIDEKKLADANATWHSISQDPSLLEVQTIRERVRRIEASLGAMTHDRDFTLLLLKDISHRIPANVMIEDLILARKEVKAPEGEGEASLPADRGMNAEGRWELEFEGTILSSRALAEVTLAEIMLDLERSPFLDRPSLLSLEEVEGFEDQASTFSITCDVLRPDQDRAGVQEES